VRNANDKLSPAHVAAVRLRWALAASLVLLATAASCVRSFRNPFKPWTPPAPDVLVAGSSLDQIVAAVNQNSQKIASYQTTNASIKVLGSPGVPSLRGNIAAQRPGRMRLEASTAITGKEVDLGANDELFWVWVRRSEPPALYYSRHDRYAGSAAQQFLPIEPQWLLDALGLAELRTGDFHEGPKPLGKDKVEVRSVVQSTSGPLTKRTVIDARKAWVLEQYVYDRSGALLASAVAKSHSYYDKLAISLPQEVEVQIPAAGLALSIDVGTVTLNGPIDNAQVWAMPAIPGSPAVDLGTAPPNSPGGGAPNLGDQLTRADWNNAAQPSPSPNVLNPLPPSTPAAVGVPLPVAVGPPLSGAVSAPQFVPPAGQPTAPADPFSTRQSLASPVAQRLPPGGIAAPEAFSR
jgi:hypothetical protein